MTNRDAINPERPSTSDLDLLLCSDDENEGFVCECCDPGTRLEGSLDKKAASSSEDNSEVDQETPEVY